jgi:hypothetical protein
MKKKHCHNCSNTLPVSSFAKNKSRKDGYQTQCRVCMSKRRKNMSTEKRREYKVTYKQTLRDNPVLKERADVVRRKYDNDRYRENIEHRLKTIVSVHIRSALNEEYEPHVFKHLGYTPTQLKEHLESQFDSRMSWDTHGQYGWHIDHIVPQSSLPFTDYTDENFLKCWSLDNLQPLWWDENLAKSNKIADMKIYIDTVAKLNEGSK